LLESTNSRNYSHSFEVIKRRETFETQTTKTQQNQRHRILDLGDHSVAIGMPDWIVASMTSSSFPRTASRVLKKNGKSNTESVTSPSSEETILHFALIKPPSANSQATGSNTPDLIYSWYSPGCYVVHSHPHEPVDMSSLLMNEQSNPYQVRFINLLVLFNYNHILKFIVYILSKCS
jgi:hypothetical protein